MRNKAKKGEKKTRKMSTTREKKLHHRNKQRRNERVSKTNMSKYLRKYWACTKRSTKETVLIDSLPPTHLLVLEREKTRLHGMVLFLMLLPCIFLTLSFSHSLFFLTGFQLLFHLHIYLFIFVVVVVFFCCVCVCVWRQRGLAMSTTFQHFYWLRWRINRRMMGQKKKTDTEQLRIAIHFFHSIIFC